MTTITRLLTNKAYGYPTRGARRRRKPTILACLHQTANAKATAIQERNYANRAGSTGPSATAYIDRDGTIVRAIDPAKYAAWRAALRFAKDRDLGRLEATMARLDAEAAAAVVRPSRTPTAAEARAYLEALPDLWAKTSDAGRHAIAEAVFERIDVLGVNDFTFLLTAHAKAHGWDAAFGAGDQSISIGRSGRGERSRDDDIDAGPRAARRMTSGPARAVRGDRRSAERES
jgi:hypothetical protein